MRILAISGSLRAASSNTAVLQAAIELAPPDVEIVRCDGLSELPHFNPDLDDANAPAPVANWRAQLKAADGVLISSPEYAHGVPGSLKNALDWWSEAVSS
jgi:NAD(P)H-dependent FMN reductase